jgi:hypothetical protein
MEHFQTLSTHPNPCCTQIILLAAHARFELKELNYDKFFIENLQCIPTPSNGDVLFEYALVVNFDGQYGEMQGMDKKHDGHAWCKVNITNIKNDFNFTFQKACCLGHLQSKMKATIFFFLKYIFLKIAWNSDIVHNFKGNYFITSPPYCKIYNNAPFCVNMCAIRM